MGMRCQATNLLKDAHGGLMVRNGDDYDFRGLQPCVFQYVDLCSISHLAAEAKRHRFPHTLTIKIDNQHAIGSAEEHLPRYLAGRAEANDHDIRRALTTV
ncbi:MAG: hypothetical protein AMXMBFR13_17640 [Phycisphaerae bacterium]